MGIHYYLGWFSTFFPKRLTKALQEDITDRTSLVMISGSPAFPEENGAAERSWLYEAGILFEAYHLINASVQQEEAHRLLQHASVIFLLGGNTLEQNAFLQDYGMTDFINRSNALVMGASAGAINMSAKWLASREFGNEIETRTVYDGIGLGNFSVLSHFDLENNMALVQNELAPLSEQMAIYASNKDCALRVQNGHIDVFGEVYLLAHGQIRKLDETFKAE